MPAAFATALDAGRRRQVNEDAIEVDADCGLAVLADGMGGHNAGEVASACAVSTICRDLGRWLRTSPQPPGLTGLRAAMHRSIAHANETIVETARTRADCSGMGTTVVVLVLNGPQVTIGHVGDSRAYRWRDGQLHPLTRDHSLVEERLAAGRISPGQAAALPDRHVLTRALGGSFDVEPEINTYPVQGDDILVMCSDGLTEMLDDREIAAVLGTHGHLEDACRALVQAANSAGGRDNIAVVLARPGRP
jgi:PPM family protein phosphatase